MLLAKRLKHLTGKDVVVYALPRGGVIPGVIIANFLNAPLDLIVARKITHPDNREYALAATTESGEIVCDNNALFKEKWFTNEIKAQVIEANRRKKLYLGKKKSLSAKGKIALLVDDGAATGLTLQAGILELKKFLPKKIAIAVPVIPASSAKVLRGKVDELITLDIPEENMFSGVAGYYKDFSQVEDIDVIKALADYNNRGNKLIKETEGVQV